jgi:hypothetical protein
VVGFGVNEWAELNVRVGALKEVGSDIEEKNIPGRGACSLRIVYFIAPA